VNKGNRFSGNDQLAGPLVLGCAIVICFILMTGAFAGIASAASASVVHVWEKKELTFTSSRSWDNPYVEVALWADLSGRVSGSDSSDLGVVTANFAFDYSLPLRGSGRGGLVRIRPILASPDCVVKSSGPVQ
jgi:hypothetical protein